MRILTLAAIMLFIVTSCRKDYVESGGLAETNNLSKRNTTLAPGSMEVGERVNGIVICSIDEDILTAAVENYYGRQSVKKIWMKEFKAGTPDSYFVIGGVIKSWWKKKLHFSFELVPVPTSNGDLELWLPVEGTEQHVKGNYCNKCKMKTTSATTANVLGGPFCFLKYSKSVSTSDTDNFGTNKLITEINALL